MKKKSILVLLTVFILVALSACGHQSGQNDKPVVYTSFYPITDLTRQIAGDTVEVRSFMPENKEAHLWEPTPKDMKNLAKADMLIVNGANMERWVDQVRDVMPDLKVVTLSDNVELITYKGAAAKGDFQYMSSLDLKKDTKYKIDFGHTHEDVMRVAFIKNDGNLSEKDLINKGKKIMNEEGELITQHHTIDVTEDKVYRLEMGHESGEIFYKLPSDGNWVFISDRVSEEILPYDLTDLDGKKLQEKVMMDSSTSGLDKVTYDPHSWLSIKNAKKYLIAIHDEFIKQYPENEDIYRKNKLKAVDKLTDLEYEYKDKFSKLNHDKEKYFVTVHNAYAYLARDFNLKQYSLQGLTSTETPSLKTTKKAISFCEYYGINTVFYEYGGVKKGADTLASEISGKSSPLASMEYSYSFKGENLHDYADVMRMNLENLYQSFREGE